LRSVTSLILDGEGILHAFEFLFQRLDTPSVVGEDLLFNSVQPTINLGNIFAYILDVFLARHGALNHFSKRFNGFMSLAIYMYA
jgi:hypothetical protein